MSSITTLLNNNLGNSTSTAASTANAASSSSASTGNSSADAAKLLGTTDQFLKILLAQLKYQDPTQPMKGTEFIDSISRLSNVEQSINTNKNLENISNILKGNNAQFGNPVSYVDKTIDFNSSQFALTNHLGGFSYNLDATDPPKNISIVIKDAKGNVVVNTQGTSKPGLNAVKWDGTDNSGNQLVDGLYTVEVSYPDPKNSTRPADEAQAISISTFTTGKVTSADFTGTEPVLSVGGIAIPITAVRSLHGTGV